MNSYSPSINRITQATTSKIPGWLMWIGQFLFRPNQLKPVPRRARQFLAAVFWTFVLYILVGLLYWVILPVSVPSGDWLAAPVSEVLGAKTPPSTTPVVEPPVSPSAETPPVPMSRQDFIRRLSEEGESVPFVSSAIWAIVKVLPLLIFLFLWKSVPKTQVEPLARGFLAGLAATISIFLLFHFTFYFFVGSQNLNDWVLKTTQFYPQWELTHLLQDVPFDVASIVIGIMVSVALMQKSRQLELSFWPKWGTWLDKGTNVLFGAGLFVPILYILGLLAWGQDDPSSWPAFVAVIPCISVLAMYVSLMLTLIYRRVMPLHKPLPGLVSLAIWLILIVTIVQTRWDDPFLQSLTWFALAVTLGACLLVALYGLIRGQALLVIEPQPAQAEISETEQPESSIEQSASSRQILARSKTLFYNVLDKLVRPEHQTYRVLITLAMVLAIPLHSIARPSGLWAYSSDLVSLASVADNLVPFIWLAAILWVLYVSGKNTQKVEPLTQWLAILGACVALFPITESWLNIPVTFLLGLLLLYWLVRPTEYWHSLEGLYQSVVEKRLELLDKIIDLNTAESRYKAFRRQGIREIASGKGDLEQYHKDLETQKERIVKLEEDAKVGGRPAKEVVLAFGPCDSAWKNGLHGAKWAALLALPWMGLFLGNFLAGPVPNHGYPLGTFAADILTVIIKWTAYGFIFGYLYPYLWGENGMLKGLALWAVSIAPYLPLMAVVNTANTGWQASLFWALQVFIQCMSLGLVAFEYSILRQGRYDWQMLFEVHGLASVGISVSSILVAAGAAATALLTSQAGLLVTDALKFVTGIR